MEQSDLLRFVVSVVERLELPYFVTGSTVTIFCGEPRFTNDIDVVVDLPLGAVEAFCRQFPAGSRRRGLGRVVFVFGRRHREEARPSPLTQRQAHGGELPPPGRILCPHRS